MPLTDIPNLRDIYTARKAIDPYIRRTPLERSGKISRALDADVFLKFENLQVSGSFKIRGALNKVLHLSDEQRRKGLITVSSGNHGRAVATIAKRMGLHATICLASSVPANKIQTIEELGADVIIGGDTYDEVAEHAAGLTEEQGLTMIHPFDDPEVIAGQGTVGLEIIEELPEVDCIIVPLSGGGLLSGIALAMKAVRPAIRLYGVSMERGAAMIESLRHGRIVRVKEGPTLADALAGGLGLENHYTFRILQAHLDGTVQVTEEEIASAMKFALEDLHMALEGAAAVSIAALMHEKLPDPGQTIVAVLSGGNVSLPTLLRAVGYGEAAP